jgi:hypothetical protein
MNTAFWSARKITSVEAKLCVLPSGSSAILRLPWLHLTLILLMRKKGWAPNSIPLYVYIQQDATLHSLFISGNCSTCFGWYFHQSSGAHTTVSTASSICHTVTAICRYRGRVGTGLSVLWVAYAHYKALTNTHISKPTHTYTYKENIKQPE